MTHEPGEKLVVGCLLPPDSTIDATGSSGFNRASGLNKGSAPEVLAVAKALDDAAEVGPGTDPMKLSGIATAARLKAEADKRAEYTRTQRRAAYRFEIVPLVWRFGVHRDPFLVVHSFGPFRLVTPRF